MFLNPKRKNISNLILYRVTEMQILLPSPPLPGIHSDSGVLSREGSSPPVKAEGYEPFRPRFESKWFK